MMATRDETTAFDSENGADEDRSGALNALRERVFRDVSNAACGALVLLGDRLGLYRAMVEAGPIDSIDLARKTGTAERYLRDWLAAQAAAGYVDYDGETQRYRLSADQAAVLANEEDPDFSIGGFEIAAALWRDESSVAEVFRSGDGLAWREYSACLHRGWERYFGTRNGRHLVNDWIPTLEGVAEKLEGGGLVADVGCGQGAAIAMLARAYPVSCCVGFDSHAASIENARKLADASDLAGRVRFEVASAKDFPGADFDLITCLHSLQDLGDPTGAVGRIRDALAPDGSFLLVAPTAGPSLEDNLNPIGQLHYALSAMVHGPGSRSQEVGACLGAQACEERLREVLFAGGFQRVRRIVRSEHSLVLEARG